MSDFRVKSDAVDVDAITRQIRERIREKRGNGVTYSGRAHMEFDEEDESLD